MVTTKSNIDNTYFTTTIIILLIISCITLVFRSNTVVTELENQLYTKDLVIDSLQHANDSLIEQYQLFDYIVKPMNYMIDVIDAIMEVESSNNDSAYNADEDAVGCMQIRKCMVDDVNRILKRNNISYRYSYNDRWSRSKSIQMFDIYCKHYRLNTAEKMARCWNGGPKGMQNNITVTYWNKVNNKLDI
tara:strand:+ start:100 stop:666 length:567 start_codon:yes stop_codon:yes gene_type:complete